MIHVSGFDTTFDILRHLPAKNEILSADRAGRAQERDDQPQDVRGYPDERSRHLQHVLIIPESARVCRTRPPKYRGAKLLRTTVPRIAYRADLDHEADLRLRDDDVALNMRASGRRAGRASGLTGRGACARRPAHGAAIANCARFRTCCSLQPPARVEYLVAIGEVVEQQRRAANPARVACRCYRSRTKLRP